MAISTLTSKISNNFVSIQKISQLKKCRNWKLLYKNPFVSEIIKHFEKQLSSYRYPVEKALWWMINCLAILVMIYMVIDATNEYKRSPTVTTAELKKFPIQKIDFPGISICNINRISQRAAADLAEELFEFPTTAYVANVTISELTRMLIHMGHLYHFEMDYNYFERMKLLHTILERGYNGYNVKRLMKRLTPTCRNELRRCSWGGRDQTCDDIFYVRSTQDGFCCTFNYGRRDGAFGSAERDIFASQQVERSRDTGPQSGLSILLNPQTEDYTLPLLPTEGFKILIHSPLDYPDMTSGSAQEILIPPRTENFIDLKAVSTYAKQDVKNYDVIERDCLFNTEQSKKFQGYYSFSDCIVYCRVEDILRICKCLPFFYPPLDNKVIPRTCNLMDVPCLSEFKERWMNLYPRLEKPMVSTMRIEFAESWKYLNCDCLPTCEHFTYSASISSIPLSTSELTWDRSKKFIVKNHSVVHIYFGKPDSIRLRQDVLFYWYELMSNYGGICSFFLGLSIINVIEILYKIISYWISEKSVSYSNEDEIKTITVSKAPTLYWKEITSAVDYKKNLLHFEFKPILIDSS